MFPDLSETVPERDNHVSAQSGSDLLKAIKSCSTAVGRLEPQVDSSGNYKYNVNGSARW